MTLKENEIIIGNYFGDIVCESFRDPETSRIRVRPVAGGQLPKHLLFECSKFEREASPIGTKFIASNVKACRKPYGRIYL
jgi:hypothetical protein